jgi:ribosomal protein L37AE/L43A
MPIKFPVLAGNCNHCHKLIHVLRDDNTWSCPKCGKTVAVLDFKPYKVKQFS